MCRCWCGSPTTTRTLKQPDGPRFRWIDGLQVSVEDGFPPDTLDGLRERGHELVIVDDYNQFGSCQAIWRLEDGYVAASDPRRDGQAAGF